MKMYRDVGPDLEVTSEAVVYIADGPGPSVVEVYPWRDPRYEAMVMPMPRGQKLHAYVVSAKDSIPREVAYNPKWRKRSRERRGWDMAQTIVKLLDDGGLMHESVQPFDRHSGMR